MKAFRLDIHSVYDKDPCHLDCLDSLLQVVVKPGIEELGLTLTRHGNYNFPRPLLSGGIGGNSSISLFQAVNFTPL